MMFRWSRVVATQRIGWLVIVIVGGLGRFLASARCADPAEVATRGAPAPFFLTDLKEVSRPVRLPDRRLLAVFFGSAKEGQQLSGRYSNDNGKSWGEVEPLLLIPKEEGGFGSPEPLVDREGELHVFLLKGRKKTPSGLDIDIWHARSFDGRTRWLQPRRIWEGYTGSLNCVIQMRTGRIVLPFSYKTNRTWAERGDGVDAFTYMGTFDSTVLYSDDGGATWQVSPTPLKVLAPDLGTYGAIEPVVVERNDGKVWMLIRTQHGRFYDSLSEDGAKWSKPKPTRILSSDSPAGLVRLDDGRIAMFWNNCLRFPYAYGGRHVLHGAISSDDGKTWRGFREIARNPRRHEPPPPRGDHGATYPIPCAVNDGKVITTTGLPSPHYNLFVDPAWLYETSRVDDLRQGLEEWSVFGVKGVELVPHPEQPDRQVLSLRKPEPDWPAGAVWNFPAGMKGRLQLRLRLKPGFAGARIGMTDHFSVPFDELDPFHNLFNLSIAADGSIGTSEKLPLDRWIDLTFVWDNEARTCAVSHDGRTIVTLRQNRDTLGTCYLRLISTAEPTDTAGLLVEKVEVKVSGDAGPR